MQSIPASQIEERLRTENPWWLPPHGIMPEYKRYRPREYLRLFYPLVGQTSVRRAVVLMGPRRVGKTVLIHHVIQQLIADGVDPSRILYVSVDHPLYNGLRLDEFLTYFENANGINVRAEPAYVFFDEIQYLREWEVHLKALVDEHAGIKFVASGSAAAALRLRSSESGAGRFTDFLLPPLTFHEYLTLLDRSELVESPKEEPHFFTSERLNELNARFVHYLNFGGYPEVLFSEVIQAQPQRYIKSDIIDKVLLRDLPGLYGITDIQELNYLFTTLAFNTAQEVSLDELSQNSGVAKNTIKRYIEYLEAAFLVKIVHRIDRNARRFKRANYFKVYLTNPSMRTALFSVIEGNDPAMGPLAETAIFSQWFHADNQTLHYARWSNGEVDIVRLDGQDVHWAVEVKWSDEYFHNPHQLKSLLAFCRDNHLRKVLATTRSVSGVKRVGDISLEFVPTSLYCFTVGYNIVRHKSSTEIPTPVA